MSLLFRNPAMRTTTTHHEQASTGEITVATEQDVTGIIADNKRRYNTFDERSRYSAESFDLCARVPMVIWMRLWQDGIAQDPRAFTRWLDDPDNKVWKARPGLLSRTTRRT